MRKNQNRKQNRNAMHNRTQSGKHPECSGSALTHKKHKQHSSSINAVTEKGSRLQKRAVLLEADQSPSNPRTLI
jgi:hypothetical protein